MKPHISAVDYDRKKRNGNPFMFILKTAFLVVVAVVTPQCAGMSSHPLQGQEAPSFSLRLMDGGTLNLSEHLGKRPIVLDFWAVWCPACRAGLPNLAAVVAQFKKEDVMICSVNMGDTRDGIASFLKNSSVKLPVAMDERNAVGGSYQVESIPTKILINREGKVAQVIVGTLGESALSEAIRKLL
jgi:peroxiredoxin